ncbi:MAG: hypothetical protein PHQ00_06965 [Phycisphaerae bacterium]|nr:hypothetical protein [Phycisphaerae bacterium]
MSEKYSVGQMNQLGDGLEASDFSVDEVTKLRNPAVLRQVKLYLLGLVTIVRVCFKLALDKALDPSSFIGKDWKIWKGPTDGDGLTGDEDYVPEPDIVDFEQIMLETHLQGEETSIYGEEKMKRARESKNRQLGDKAFLALWNNWLSCKSAGKSEDSILERLRWSGKIGTVVYFFGRTLRRPGGNRCVLCLYFGGGGWRWDYYWLDDRWGDDISSVALASVLN